MSTPLRQEISKQLEEVYDYHMNSCRCPNRPHSADFFDGIAAAIRKINPEPTDG